MRPGRQPAVRPAVQFAGTPPPACTPEANPAAQLLLRAMRLLLLLCVAAAGVAACPNEAAASADLALAKADFLRRHPEYGYGGSIDELWERVRARARGGIWGGHAHDAPASSPPTG